MCSHRVQLCALIAPAAARLSTSAVLAVVVRVSVVVGTLTGPLGRPSAARLAIVAAAVGSDAYLPPAVGQREADLRRERRVVGAEVGEEGVPARPCHCDCVLPGPCAPLHPSSPKRSGFHDKTTSPSPAEAGTPGAATPLVVTGCDQVNSQAGNPTTVDHRSRPVSASPALILRASIRAHPQAVIDHPTVIRSRPAHAAHTPIAWTSRSRSIPFGSGTQAWAMPSTAS
jgi:hypothetical protein